MPRTANVRLPGSVRLGLGAAVLILPVFTFAQAAVPHVKLEAEAGSLAGNSLAGSDSLASGGGYISFIAGTGSGLPFTATFENPSDASLFKFETHYGTGAVTPTDPEIRTWAGDHNLACAGPSTTRTVHVELFAEHFYHCPAFGADTGHIHTSMRTTAYAQVGFSPNRSFSSINKICWDMSMQDIGGRRHPRVSVVSEATYQAHNQRLDYVVDNTQLGETSSVQLGSQDFMLAVVRGSTSTYVGRSISDDDFGGFVNGTDKLRRFRHCITDNENGTVNLTLERSTGTDTRTMRGALPNGPARVIFADFNYNPPKDDISTADPNTIHWDNITIE